MGNLDNEYNAARDRIFDLLKSKNISQKDFAIAIGVSPQTITDWKNGKSRSFIGMAAVIAPILGTTAGWLLFGQDKENQPVQQYETALRAEIIQLKELRKQSKKDWNETLESMLSLIDHVIDIISDSDRKTENSPPSEESGLPHIWNMLNSEDKQNAVDYMKYLAAKREKS